METKLNKCVKCYRTYLSNDFALCNKCLTRKEN